MPMSLRASLSFFPGTPKSFAQFAAVFRSSATGATLSGQVPVACMLLDPG
jgi:hypothetical protein